MGDITIIDIARQAGVSIKTVSRVLNREEGVGAETRARVEALIVRLGYRPNASARSLSSRRSYLIGAIFMRVGAYHFVGQVQEGAMRACRKAGYHLVLEQVDPPEAVGRAAFVQALRAAKFDGVVLTPPICDDAEVLSNIEDAGLPYVRMAPHTDLERAPCVLMDDYEAARLVVGRLWMLGHRKLGLVEGDMLHGSARRRKEGFLDALRERGGEIRPEWIASGDFQSLSGFHAGDRLLDQVDRPTAIFVSNDEMAMGVLAAAAKHGLQVPHDLSLVGFDDTPAAEASWPPLSTIHQPTAAMAEAAVTMLIGGFGDERLRDRSAARTMAFHFVERASTASPAP